MRTFKKSLSIFLCFVMLFTTFCFFPLTGLGVEADAAVTAQNGENRTAFYAPEVIYLYPNVTSWKEATATSFQYYVGNTVDTSDIYKTPTVNASTADTGRLYFAAEEGMNDVVLSYEFQNKAGTAYEGGQIETETALRDGYYEIAIAGGKSPELAASENGCFIEWKLQYTTDSGEIKAVFAYTYVYKPYVVPYGAVARVYNTSGSVNVDNENITWVTGVHSIDENAATEVAFYPYYKTVSSSDKDTGFAFSPFLSKSNKAYVGTRAVSGQATVANGGYYAVFSSDDPDIAYFYAGQDGASLSGNYESQKWFTASKIDGTEKTDIYTVGSFDFAGASAVQAKYATAQVTPTRLGQITIDTSRYTNLNQIPNLAAGFMMTSTNVTNGGSGKGYWQIGDASEYTSGATGLYTHDTIDTDLTNAVNSIDKNNIFAEEQSISFPTANGIKYAGVWNKEILKNETTKKYTVKSVVKIDDQGEYEYTATASAVGLNATQIDKASLRDAVYEAASYLGAFGTMRNGKSLYYSALKSEWDTFFNAYTAAYKALTQLNATADEVASAETALESALATLISGKSLKVLFDVNYDNINPNLLAVADEKSSDGFSLSYNSAADTYTFNGIISQDAREFISDVSLNEGEYTLNVNYVSGSRMVNITSGNAIVVEFFKGDKQLNQLLADRLAANIEESGQSLTFPINAEFADVIDNFRLWFWVDGIHENAIEFNSLTYKLKLEKGGEATAYSPAARIITGATYGELPVPQREGYTFGGWFSDETLTTEVTAESEVSARVLYAKWIPNVYSLSFDNLFNLNEWASDGYTIKTSAEASSGNNATYNSENSSVTIVSDEKSGECYTIWDTNSYGVKIEPNTTYRFSYKVSDRNEYGDTRVFAFIYNANDERIDFADGTLWCDANKIVSGEGEYTIEFKTGADADIFRCRFGTYCQTADSVEATFSDIRLVEVNDYNNSLEIAESEKAYSFGTTYGELSEVSREGYTFDGWYTEKNGGGAKITTSTPVKSENLTVYSNWNANSYKVTLVPNGADNGNDRVISGCVYDVEFTLPSNDELQYRKTGYTFAGWSKTPDGEVLYADNATVKNVTADVNGEVTLYAVWEPIKFIVNFNANTGVGTMNSVQVAYQSGTALPECTFTKTGYSFVGWSLSAVNGSIINEEQYNTLSRNAGEAVTLFAVWGENTYNVTYDANGGEGANWNQAYLYSYEFELPTAGFTKTGYVLSGWSDTPDGEKLYNAGQKVSALNAEKNGNITLYAVWTPVTYKIKFVGTPGNGTMDAINATYDAETVLPASTFERTGYHFIGWSTVSGGEAQYNAGDNAINLTSQQNGEVTLYAVWEINSYDVALKFRDADGNWTDVTLTVNHGDSIQNTSVEGFTLYPRFSGTMHYVFSGWDTESGALQNITQSFTATAGYGNTADCALSTKVTDSTCAVKGNETTTCAFCSYIKVTELSLVAHTYNEGEITIPVTCLADGEKTYTCSVCAEGDEGHTKTEAIKAEGHKFIDNPETSTTCYVSHKYCTVCEKAYKTDATKTEAYVNSFDPSIPHTPGDAATCTTAQICTRCSVVLTEAFGHSFTETYEATTKVDCSTTKGNYTIVRTCSVCGAVEREDVVNDFLPHNYRIETFAPTCTDYGYDLYTCIACGHEEERNIIDALGHTSGEWIVTKETSCSEPGVNSHYCVTCNEVYETEEIPVIPHTYGEEWTVTLKPTCTDDGEKAILCTVCGDPSQTTVIPKLGHKESDEWTVAVKATCTEDGERQKKCTVCDEVVKTEVIPKLGHAPDGDATCEKDSVCIRCDTVLKEALGHDWNNGVITKDPTETEQGEREYTCLRDSSHKKYETIPVRIVIELPEIPADGTYDLDANENGYLGNIHDIISVEEGIAYTVSVDNLNVLTINEDGYMMAVKDGNAVITIITNDGKYQKHLPVTVRTYKTITFDVNGVLTTLKAYVGDKFDTIEVESYEDDNGYIRSFKAWLLNGALITDFTCTGDMYLTAQFTSSCDYTRFDKMAVVFEGLIGGYYDNQELITLNKQEVENAKLLIAEFRVDRNIRDSAEQGRVDAAADQISIVVAKIYPEDGASIEIRGASDCTAGTYADVKAYLMPLGVELADGVWTSSDTSIGFFVNGKFFAVRTGTVTLTVSRGNLTASKTINVNTTAGARVIFFDSLITNAHYILDGGYIIKETTNLFWAPDAEVNFRVITDGTFEEYTVYINDIKVEPDITGTYTVPANTGDAHVRIDGMVPDYTDEAPDTAEKVSIWDLIRNFFKKIGDFFKSLFGG